MKRILTFPALYGIFLALTLLNFSPAAIAYPGGSPAGYTGSPGDGQHCQSCHGGSVATVNNWITSNIPSAGYTAGSSYTITVTVSGTGKKGFEVSPQAPSGAQLGVLTAGTGNHLVGGTKYVTQNASGSSSSAVSWSFSWTAPSAGTGEVTFYGAFTVGKTNTKLSTLTVTENSTLPLSVTATATPSEVCAGQSVQLTAVAAGGSGSYTYSWTSLPAGFTSVLPDPVVMPDANTQYLVEVSDGSATAGANATVSVVQPPMAVAGNDSTVPFSAVSIPLNGTASGFAGLLWTTSGSGTFTNATALGGTYLPSDADRNAGLVTLTLTAQPVMPCAAPASSDRVIHFDPATGINEEMGFGIILSPNPSSGPFVVRWSGDEPGHWIMTVSDLLGKQVARAEREGSAAGLQSFDLSGHAAGIYLLKVESLQGSVIRKLVIR